MWQNIFIIFVKFFFFKFRIIKYEIRETQTDLMADLNLTFKPFYYEFEIEYNCNKFFIYFCRFIGFFLSISNRFNKEKFENEIKNFKSLKYSGYDVVSLKNDSFLGLRKDWFKFKLFLFEN